MPVSSRGPRRRRSWWCHTCSSTPSTRTPAKRAGSSDAACRHGLIWDHTVFHVVASCRARPAIAAPSKRNCRRVPRRARGAPATRARIQLYRPGPQTRPGCAHPLVMFQECRRLAGGFAAYPASLKPPDPHRDPGPGRVDDLHDHAPVTLCDSAHNQGSPPAGCTTQHRVPEHLGCEPRSSDGNPASQQADHTDHNDQATRSSSR